MTYALFSDDVQVSRAFATKGDVWRHAEKSGLVVEVGSADEDPPRKVLDMACTIRRCGSDMADVKLPPGEVAPLTAPDISRQIEAAAS